MWPGLTAAERPSACGRRSLTHGRCCAVGIEAPDQPDHGGGYLLFEVTGQGCLALISTIGSKWKTLQ
jgi:hypothetical protein